MIRTILAVDDSEIVLCVLQAAFENVGFTFYTANDGMEGAELVTLLAPDILITDIRMPRMDGIGLIKEVRQHMDCTALPILVHSSEQARDTHDRALRAGANEWFQKSCNTDGLIATARRLAVC